MTRLTKEVKQAIRADLESIYENEGRVIQDKEYTEGLVISMDWMAGNYSSHGAWINVMVVVTYQNRFGKKDTLWDDGEARTPIGAMRIITRLVGYFEKVIESR